MNAIAWLTARLADLIDPAGKWARLTHDPATDTDQGDHQ